MIGPADRMEANHDLYLDALLTVHKTLFSAQGATGSGEQRDTRRATDDSQSR
jgi:hypothetical protein